MGGFIDFIPLKKIFFRGENPVILRGSYDDFFICKFLCVKSVSFATDIKSVRQEATQNKPINIDLED